MFLIRKASINDLNEVLKISYQDSPVDPLVSCAVYIERIP